MSGDGDQGERAPGDGKVAAATSKKPALDAAKARRAAADPERPGQQCRAPAGQYRPQVNRRRCEGKSDCVAVCPYGVFEVRTIDEADYRSLPALTRMKVWVHGKKTSYTPQVDSCRACGLCVVACPEDAITLGERSTAP